VMPGPKAEAEVDIDGAHGAESTPRKVRASATNRDARLSSLKGRFGSYFDLSTVHSMVLPALTKPLPLQAFWPLQALAADLHALWPLQALTPVQGTWAEAAVAKVATANAVAAVATSVLAFIYFSLCWACPVVADRRKKYVP